MVPKAGVADLVRAEYGIDGRHCSAWLQSSGGHDAPHKMLKAPPRGLIPSPAAGWRDPHLFGGAGEGPKARRRVRENPNGQRRTRGAKAQRCAAALRH
jgi:hypothetical protein